MVDLFGLGIGFTLILVGIVVVVFELAHPGLFLLIPATVLIVAGILLAINPADLLSTIWGPALVGVAGVIAAAVSIPYYQRMAPIHRPMVTTPSSLQGETGVVVVDVEPNSMKGKVRIRSEVWSAQSEAPIAQGTKVRVVRGEGVSVWVAPDASFPASVGAS
ncbi:MAG TPA: NfeD family protein [Thermoplasmata archaeon]|nr:NfeD family protein [Thermoplasmata archaeon]